MPGRDKYAPKYPVHRTGVIGETPMKMTSKQRLTLAIIRLSMSAVLGRR